MKKHNYCKFYYLNGTTSIKDDVKEILHNPNGYAIEYIDKFGTIYGGEYWLYNERIDMEHRLKITLDEFKVIANIYLKTKVFG